MNSFYKKILEVPSIPIPLKKIIIIGINWIFQGILYMDKTEKIFKVSFDVFFTLIFWFIFLFLTKINFLFSLILAFILAHTVNWLLNNNLFGLFKTFGNVKTCEKTFREYLSRLIRKLEKEQSIVWVGIYGSLARGEFKETSDLDVRIIRKPGVMNGVRACIFILRERAWATFNRFPLDIYVGDSFEFLKKMRKDEEPIVLFSRQK